MKAKPLESSLAWSGGSDPVHWKPIHLRKNGAHNTNQKETKQAIKQKTLGHTKNL